MPKSLYVVFVYLTRTTVANTLFRINEINRWDSDTDGKDLHHIHLIDSVCDVRLVDVFGGSSAN